MQKWKAQLLCLIWGVGRQQMKFNCFPFAFLIMGKNKDISTCWLAFTYLFEILFPFACLSTVVFKFSVSIYVSV